MSEDFSDDFDPWGDAGDEEPVIVSFGELTAIPYACAACGETNETQFDLGGGYHQQYTEDCAVCCRPNLLTITVDEETNAATIANELEYDC
ncbi:MAG: CPXCG motif-containing cysteine-rich protein [Candidatus Kapaibacterium sp.]